MSLKTSVKGRFDVEEVNALNKKYDGDLTNRHYFKYIGLPGLFLAVLGIIFTYFWWISLALGVLGLWYGYKFVLPSIVKQNYFLASLKERNRFVNNMTQISTDKSKTVTRALEASSNRAKGELYDDLKILQASISGANKEQVTDAFFVIRAKYKHDVVFVQYMEQLETLAQEGKAAESEDGAGPLETLKEIKSYHNDMMTAQFKFLELKQGHLQDMKQIIFLLFIVMGALTFSFGFTSFYGAFARSPIGWVTSGIYLTLFLNFLNKFRKLYFDDEIMFISK